MSTNEDTSGENAAPSAAPHRNRGQRLISAIERRDHAAVRDGDLLAAISTTVDTRPATSGWTPIMMAVVAGDPEIVSTLLEAGGDAGEALLIASALERTEIALQLIGSGGNIGAVDEAGRNALSFAAQAGDVVLIRRLLEAGLDVNGRETCTGMTPLSRAALAGRDAAAVALIEAGASVTSTDSQGFTPLLYAASSAQTATSRCLLEAGADPNDRSPSGVSALGATISASAYFRQDKGALEVRPFDEAELLPVVELLVRWGAEVHPGGEELTRARELGYESVAASLSEYGCDELRQAS